MNEIHDFLENNKVDNWGYFLKTEEEKEEKMEKMNFLEKDEGKEEAEENKKDISWDFFKDMFDYKRK